MCVNQQMLCLNNIEGITVSCKSDRKPGLCSDACNRFHYLETPRRTSDSGVIKLSEGIRCFDF